MTSVTPSGATFSEHLSRRLDGRSPNLPPANLNLLGFPQNPSFTNCSLTPASQHISATTPQDARTFSAGGSTPEKALAASNLALGFQPLNSNLGKFPKISLNFDKAEGPSCAQQTQPPSAPTKNPAVNQRKALTFAEAAARKAAKPPDLFTHSFTSIKPVQTNDGLAVIMPESLYEQRLNLFQVALIGRIILPQGAAPRTAESLKGELISAFNSTGEWSLLPLCKGFFSLNFQLQED